MRKASCGSALPLAVALLTIAFLVSFVAYLSFRIQAIDVADEMAALRESNQTIRNMLVQTDAILKDQARKWGSALAARFPGGYAVSAAPPGGTPVLSSGKRVLNDRIDEIDAFTRESHGNVATIFVRRGDDFVRIATSLRKEDGSRATGTPLGQAHPAYALVSAGRDYTGIATLFGRQYMTHYQPIFDASGKTIGLLFVGMDIMDSIAEVKKTVKSIRIGRSGYAYVLDGRDGPSAGTLLIHPLQEGARPIDSRDAAGREFIREMLRQRNGTITYPWMNPSLGETVPREKVVAFSEFAEWQWIIASGAYADELFTSAGEVRSALQLAKIGLGLIALGGLSFLLHRYVISPAIAASRVERVLGVRARIVLYVCLLVAAVTGGTIVLLDRFVEQRLLAAISQQQEMTARREAHAIEDSLLTLRSNLGLVAARFPAEFLARSADAQRWADDRIVLRSLFHNVLVLDRNGTAIAETSRRPDGETRFDHRPWFRQALASPEPRIFDPQPGDFPGLKAIVVTAPIRDHGGAMHGLMVGIVSLDRSHTLIDAAESKIGRSGYFSLIGKARTYIAHPDKAMILEPIPAVAGNPEFERALQGFSGSVYGRDLHGRRGVLSFRTIPPTGWLLVGFVPEDEFIGEIIELRTTIAALAAAALFCVGLLIWHAVGRALRPLDRLNRAMRSAHDTHFQAMPKVDCAGKDELAELGRTFNAMAAAIEARTSDLVHSEQELREITSALGFGIYVLDEGGLIVFVNPATEALLGWRKDELIGHDAHRTFHYQHADGSPYPADQCPLHQALADGRSVHVLSDWLIAKDGTRIPVEIFATPILREGKIHGVVAAFQDISVQLRRNEQVRHQASHDALTGLANRRQAMDTLAQMVYRGSRFHETFSVLMLDLDGFKKINDQFGHPAGDALLIQVAQRLRRSLRQSDLLARLGGDEFLVLLNAISADDAMALAGKLIDSISAPYRLGEVEARIGVSVGVASFPATADQAESLVAAADEALYLSKAQGRNRSTLSYLRQQPCPAGQEYHPAFIALDDSLLLGTAELDEAHRALAEQINRIERLMHDGAAHEATLHAFDELAQQFMAHLAHEEDWLNEHLPADHVRHRGSPLSVQAEIRMLRDELDGADPFLGLIKLRDWLVDHIRADERLRPLIAALPNKP